jgi:UDP-N-acetylglucosamine:LPS N-acetylglucosamine transferase
VRHRVLILTATVGEGHDLPARTLAEQLRRERPDVDVVIEDCLPAMGSLVTAFSAGAPSVVFYRFQWLWDLGFWFFARCGPTRTFTQLMLTRLSRPGIVRLIGTVDPSVIVSVYPNVTEVLGRLRAGGSVGVPVVAAITDLAAMHYWATPGVDLHLITHVESIPEVREVAGDDAIVQAVHGLTAPEFLEPRRQAEARGALGLPATGKVVLVSGGGWGVGDVEGATSAALELEDVVRVVCLCGRNENLRRRLLQRFGSNQRVRVEGFTTQMPDWLSAGDALVHSTGGLTVLEAIMLGCPAISYGWGRGHVRLNNRAYRRFGLADVVSHRHELESAITRALERRRERSDEFSALPSAASCVLALVDGAA